MKNIVKISFILLLLPNFMKSNVNAQCSPDWCSRCRQQYCDYAHCVCTDNLEVILNKNKYNPDGKK